MTRLGRSLPLLLVLALWCGTGCTAANHSMRSAHSPGTAQASSPTLALQDAPSLPQTTTVQADTAAVTSPVEDRGTNRTLVVIVSLAAVALLMALVAR